MNNKGFTLTELVVGMLISSVVITCIAIYTIVGIRSFNSSRTETKANQEAEFVTMSVKEKMKTVRKYRVIENGEYYILEMISGIINDSGNYAKTDYSFIYDIPQTNLYLVNNGTIAEGEPEEFLFDEEAAINRNNLKRNGLLSNYVTGFEVYPEDPEDMTGDIMTVEFTTTVGSKSSRASFSTKLRNEQAVGYVGDEEPEEGGDEGGDEGDEG